MTVPPASRAERLLASVVNALPVVVYAFDRDGTVLLSEGSALAGMYSSPGAAVGRDVRDVFAGEAESLAHIERAIDGEAHEAELTLTRNGRSYHVWYLPSLGADGTVDIVVGLSLDVTDRRRVERELDNTSHWLNELVERLPVAIFRVDEQAALTFARGGILCQIAPEQVGKPIVEAFRDVPELLAATREALDGHNCAYSTSAAGRDFEILINGMAAGDRVAGVLGLAIELTEQRRAAAAIAENEKKSKFVATVSHELRSPLGSVAGFADLLQREQIGPLNDQQRRYLGNISSACAHMLRVVNQLLELSKALVGELDLDVQTRDAMEIVDSALEVLRPVAESRQIELRNRQRGSPQVRADRFRLMQILVNLISNALKFTPDFGQVTVAASRRGDAVVIEVIDNGIGIQPEDQERIFDEFVQLAAASRAPERGIGLGLALSRHLARAMGGDLTVRSEPGRGSTFQVRLPCGSNLKDG